MDSAGQGDQGASGYQASGYLASGYQASGSLMLLRAEKKIEISIRIVDQGVTGKYVSFYMTGTVQADGSINGEGCSYDPERYSSAELLSKHLENTCDYNSVLTGIITELDGAVRIACGITVYDQTCTYTIEINCGCPIVNNTQYKTVCTIDTGVNIRDSGHIRDRTVYIENVETQSIVQDIELKDQELESAKSAMNPTQYRPPQPIYPLGSLAALTPSQTISGPSFTNEGNSAAQYLPLPPTQFACTSAALTPSQTISGPSFTNEGNSAAQYLPPQPIYPLGSFAALEREMNPTQYLPLLPHLSPWSGPHQDIDTPPPKRPRLDATFTEPRLAPRPGIVGAEYDAGIQSEVISKHKKHQNMELESVEDGNSLMDDNMVANEPVQKRRRMRRAGSAPIKESAMNYMLQYCDKSIATKLFRTSTKHKTQVTKEGLAQVICRQKQCRILIVQLKLINVILNIICTLAVEEASFPINMKETHNIKNGLNSIISSLTGFQKKTKDFMAGDIYGTSGIRRKIIVASCYFIPAILEKIVTIYNAAIEEAHHIEAHHITVKDLLSPPTQSAFVEWCQDPIQRVIENIYDHNNSKGSEVVPYNIAAKHILSISHAWYALANEYESIVSKERQEQYFREDGALHLRDDKNVKKLFLMKDAFAALQKSVLHLFPTAQESEENPGVTVKGNTQYSILRIETYAEIERTVGAKTYTPYTETDPALKRPQKKIKQEEHIRGKQLWEVYFDSQADIKCIKGMDATQCIESIQDIKNIEKESARNGSILDILSKCFGVMRVFVLGKYEAQENMGTEDIWGQLRKAIRLEANKPGLQAQILKLAFIDLARNSANDKCYSHVMHLLCNLKKKTNLLTLAIESRIGELITNINKEGITILDTLVGDNLDDQKNLIRSGRFLRLILLVALHVRGEMGVDGNMMNGKMFMLRNTCIRIKHLNSEDTPGFDARPKAKLIKFSWLEEFIDQLHSLETQTYLQIVEEMNAKEKELSTQGTITKEEGGEAFYKLLLPKSKAPGELDEAGCEQIQEELGEPRAAALCYTA